MSDILSHSQATYRLGLLQIKYYVPTMTAGDSSVSAATATTTYALADEQAACDKADSVGPSSATGQVRVCRSWPVARQQ